MQIVFTLIARTAIDVRTVTVSSDGTNFIVQTDSSSRHVRTLRQAIHLGCDELNDFLAPIERSKTPWGLYVSVAGVAAFYGELPPNLPRSGGSPLPPGELINRIRDDYKPGDGPLAALRNARGVRKPVRHAARAYSLMSPPRRWRRLIWPAGFESTG